MVSGEPTTICGSAIELRKSFTVGVESAGQALIIDRNAPRMPGISSRMSRSGVAGSNWPRSMPLRLEK